MYDIFLSISVLLTREVTKWWKISFKVIFQSVLCNFFFNY